MNNLLTFKNIVEKNNLYIYMVYRCLNPFNINPNDFYPIIEETLNEIDEMVSYDELLIIIRTVFKEFIEKDLVLNVYKKNITYTIHYNDKKLIEFRVNKQIDNNTEISYINSDGICNYSINTIDKNINMKLFDYLMEDVPKKVKKVKNC